MKNRLRELFAANRHLGQGLRAEMSGEDEASIYLYDAIGGWFGIPAEEFVKELNSLKASTIHLRINSPGGDVFEARAIATAVRSHRAKVIAHIDGLAASAATYIATAADEVEIGSGGFFMVHNAWGINIGNADEMDEFAGLLRKIDDSIAADYQAKTGADLEQVKSWMHEETWFTAEEAVSHGFADRVGEADSGAENRWDLSVYSKAPEDLTSPPADEAEYDREELERRLAMLVQTAP